MDLDLQIRSLIDKAPPDGSTPQILEAIAPALRLLAEQLEHLEYYILQNFDQSWAIVVLSNLKQPGPEKKVIYAWTTLKDASQAQAAAGDRVLPAVGQPGSAVRPGNHTVGRRAAAQRNQF